MHPSLGKIWSTLRPRLTTAVSTAGSATPILSPTPSVSSPAPVAAPVVEAPAVPALSDEEIRARAHAAIEEVGARGPVDQERVMGHLMPHLRGRAEGSRVAAIVAQLLAERDGVA